MLDRIRQFFRPSLTEESRAFVTKLAESYIWVPAIGLRGVPEHAGAALDDPACIDMLRKHRIDVSETGDDDSILPLNYEENGRQLLPFFSSEELIPRFFAEIRIPGSAEIFQPCRLRSGFVATPENEPFQLVFDPRTPNERVLTHPERLLLRSLSKPAV